MSEMLDFRVGKNEKDIEALYGKVNNIDVSRAETSTNMLHVMEALGRVEQSVEDLKNRPRKHWDSFVGALIGALASGLVGFLLATLLR